MPDDLMRRLREPLARRRQPVVMINAEKQRLAKAADKLTQRSCKTILRSLEAERARIDRAIDKLIEQSPLFCARQDRSKASPDHTSAINSTVDSAPTRAASTKLQPSITPARPFISRQAPAKKSTPEPPGAS